MKAAVIGSGGREHALAWRLSISDSVEEVIALPGSKAMESCATCVPVSWEDSEKLLATLREKQIDIVVIGPEAPLVAGVSDFLRDAGVAVFGPSKGAARLEGSKQFAKEIMEKYNIPTAKYEVFTDVHEAKNYIEQEGAPIVIKADGLAAGKGVVVAQTVEEAKAAVEDMLSNNRLGEAGHSVVIEECMVGEEASLLAFVDGEHIVPMVAAQDHKRIFDGDMGPNTGGMGAYAPAPVLTEELKEQAMKEILLPMVEAMKQEGYPYQGCLYTGLMMTANGPKVVEFNARFGDPETQVLLPLLDSDFGNIVEACATGTLHEELVHWKKGSVACVVMASAGYPESSHKGDVIHGPLEVETDSWIFHSGTDFVDGAYQTAGGRVLGVTAFGDQLKTALTKAYHRVEAIHFDGEQYRTDIGQKAFKD